MIRLITGLSLRDTNFTLLKNGCLKIWQHWKTTPERRAKPIPAALLGRQEGRKKKPRWESLWLLAKPYETITSVTRQCCQMSPGKAASRPPPSLALIYRRWYFRGVEEASLKAATRLGEAGGGWGRGLLTLPGLFDSTCTTPVYGRTHAQFTVPLITWTLDSTRFYSISRLSLLRVLLLPSFCTASTIIYRLHGRTCFSKVRSLKRVSVVTLG